MAIKRFLELNIAGAMAYAKLTNDSTINFNIRINEKIGKVILEVADVNLKQSEIIENFVSGLEKVNFVVDKRHLEDLSEALISLGLMELSYECLKAISKMND